MNVDVKIPKEIANGIRQCIKRITHYIQVGFVLGIQALFNIQKSIKVIHHIDRLKKKKIRCPYQ